MLNRFAWILTLAALTASPAWAQGACNAPAMPAAVDAAKASVADIRAALTAAQGFIAASDLYQQCLQKDVDARKAAATKDNPFDPAVEKDMQAKAADNQAMKQKVADNANNAIAAFKKAHACENKPLASCQ